MNNEIDTFHLIESGLNWGCLSLAEENALRSGQKRLLCGARWGHSFNGSHNWLVGKKEVERLTCDTCRLLAFGLKMKLGR